jgi:hypothetical protein
MEEKRNGSVPPVANNGEFNSIRAFLVLIFFPSHFKGLKARALVFEVKEAYPQNVLAIYVFS